MDRKLLALLSVVIGIALFVILLAVVGFESILTPFMNVSFFYLGLFLLSSALLFMVYVFRWASVLKYQGIPAPFLLLLKYKLISSAIGYITPAARIGGEPLRAYLFKRHFNVKGRQAVSAIILETTIGASVDMLFVAVMVFFLLLFFAFPGGLAGIALLLSLAGVLLIAVYFSTLMSRRGPFSGIASLLYAVIHLRVLKHIIGKMQIVESIMSDFLLSRKKGVMATVGIALISWPLTMLQYKFALLSIGFDAPVQVVVLSIIATTLASVIPIPASMGVQEASQFSIFRILGAANFGIALSLLIRLKDLIVTFLGLTLLSHEGLGILDVLRSHKK